MFRETVASILLASAAIAATGSASIASDSAHVVSDHRSPSAIIAQPARCAITA